jgi:hypothetical protein
MDIYDPIAEALGMEPAKIKFLTLSEAILLGIVEPWNHQSDIVPWNKGLSLPSPLKGVKVGKQKFPKKYLTEGHKAKLKGPNPKLKKYAAERTPEHLDKIKKAATKQTTCKYCSIVAAQVSIARWHNEKCKHKP